MLGLGGYAAGAAVKLAARAGVPAAILNPDVIPGRANRYLMRFVRRVCCGFDATAGHVDDAHRAKLTTTGCPILRAFADRPDRRTAAAALGLDPRLQTLVVTGASQGARSVNEAVLEALRQILAGGGTLQGWQVLHLAGKDHAGPVREAYRTLPGVAARVVDFTPGLAGVWAVADLAVSRSGAGSVAELTACGGPVAAAALPVPQGPAPARQRPGPGRRRGGGAAGGPPRRPRQRRAFAAGAGGAALQRRPPPGDGGSGRGAGPARRGADGRGG